MKRKVLCEIPERRREKTFSFNIYIYILFSGPEVKRNMKFDMCTVLSHFSWLTLSPHGL